MGDNSGTRSVVPKAFLFRAQNLAGLDIVRRKDDYTCGPEFVDHIRHCDKAVVIHRSWVPLFVKEDGVALEPRRGCYPGYGEGLKEEVECLMELLGHVFEHQAWGPVWPGGLVIGGAA